MIRRPRWRCANPTAASHERTNRAILDGKGSDRTGVLVTPPLPGPNHCSTSTTPKELRLMADSTYPAHVCTVPRAVSHSGGTNLPDIRPGWSKDRRTFGDTGLVYYFERADGAVKIGCTVNYPQRRQALTQRHGRLRLVAWEFGYSDVEAYRHRQFAHLRIDPIAEWFRVDCDLYDHILSLLAVL